MGLQVQLFLDPRKPGLVEVENYSGRTVRLRVQAKGRTNKVVMSAEDFQQFDEACQEMGGAQVVGSMFPPMADKPRTETKAEKKAREKAEGSEPKE